MSKKQDIRPTNAEGQTHGLWISYYPNGNIWYKIRYVNGVKHGISEEYWDNGESWYKDYYNNGKCVYLESYTGSNRIRFNI